MACFSDFRDRFHFHRAEGKDRKPFISFNKSTLSSCHAGNPTGCVFDSYNVQSVAGGFTVIGDQLNFYFGSDRGDNANGAQGNSSVSIGHLRRMASHTSAALAKLNGYVLTRPCSPAERGTNICSSTSIYWRHPLRCHSQCGDGRSISWI